MNDIRRNILWGVFLVSLLMLWDAWNKHNGHPTMFGMPVSRPVVAASAPAGGSDVPAAAGPAGSTSLPGATGGAAATVPAAAPVVVRTDVVDATFDPRGGQLVRLALLKQPRTDDPKRPVVLFDRSRDHTYLAQTGLIGAPDGTEWPNHLAPMTWLPGRTTLEPGTDSLVVAFESTQGGITLVKRFTFSRGSYAIRVQHEVVNAGAAPAAPLLYLQLERDGKLPEGEVSGNGLTGPAAAYTGPVVYSAEEKFHKVDFASIDKGTPLPRTRSDGGWVGMIQHYFASMWVVPTPGAREFRVGRPQPGLYTVAMVQPLGTLAPGARTTHESMLYAGPQDEKKLEALAPGQGLELVKDYGVLTILAKPLFWLLDKLHSLIGNWGWAIVGLVVLLKAAFYFLNAHAYTSMARMKAVNPRLQALREQFKDDPQQMQQAMMRIYREEKINPLGGCLPIFVQMPFFFALYWVLLASVEMRGQPWIGWIQDLSVRDPYFILPIIMTLSTVLQTALNPPPADPIQKKMMWIMPLVFSVFFFFFPAGLVLYWLTNNLLGIAQQWTINRKMGVKEIGA